MKAVPVVISVSLTPTPPLLSCPTVLCHLLASNLINSFYKLLVPISLFTFFCFISNHLFKDNSSAQSPLEEDQIK